MLPVNRFLARLMVLMGLPVGTSGKMPVIPLPAAAKVVRFEEKKHDGIVP